jgi:hypothetical protein
VSRWSSIGPRLFEIMHRHLSAWMWPRSEFCSDDDVASQRTMWLTTWHRRG